MILFDNSDHDGQIPISLQTLPERLRCPTADGGENTIESTRLISFPLNQVSIIISILAFTYFFDISCHIFMFQCSVA